MTALVVVILAAALVVVIKPQPIRLAGEIFGIGRPHRLLPAVAAQTGSTSYVFSNIDAAGDPVTYDPCRAIHYAINPEGGPPDYLAFIQPAVQAAQSASGLEFVYDGITSSTFADRQNARRSEPVVIAFEPVLVGAEVRAESVGLGGSVSMLLNGRKQPHYLTGSIALKIDWFQRESAERKTAEEQAVVMHELGHVLGLGHVPDPSQLMFAQNRGQLTYGAGDLAGLAKLGSGHCAA